MAVDGRRGANATRGQAGPAKERGSCSRRSGYSDSAACARALCTRPRRRRRRRRERHQVVELPREARSKPARSAKGLQHTGRGLFSAANVQAVSLPVGCTPGPRSAPGGASSFCSGSRPCQAQRAAQHGQRTRLAAVRVALPQWRRPLPNARPDGSIRGPGVLVVQAAALGPCGPCPGTPSLRLFTHNAFCPTLGPTLGPTPRTRGVGLRSYGLDFRREAEARPGLGAECGVRVLDKSHDSHWFRFLHARYDTALVVEERSAWRVGSPAALPCGADTRLPTRLCAGAPACCTITWRRAL